MIQVGPYCVIEEKVEIGDGCRLDAFSQVKELHLHGPGNHVHSYACIGDEPQHLGFKGEETWVRIGERTTSASSSPCTGALRTGIS